YSQHQTHGFEVDLIGSRSDRLVLATVKSFFGSRGVVAEEVTDPKAKGGKRYALLNDPSVRDVVVAGAADRYGYRLDQVGVRLYVGRFAGPKAGTDERTIRDWCDQQHVGGGPITVHGVEEVVGLVRKAAATKTYRNNAVLVSLKVLHAAGALV